MGLANRRNAMKIAVFAAVAPQLASRSAWALTVPGTQIAPPIAPMIYDRTLERQMSGGATFTVTRDFSVQFVPLVSGFQLQGHQIAARVRAPENLKSFAALEEGRVETGIFPLLLDRSGGIVNGSDPQLSNELELALKTAGEQLGLTNDGDGNEVAQLIASLHRAGAQMTAQLPHDIFAPTETFRRHQQDITLPWGDTGAVTTIFQAEKDPETGLMREASREVVTRIGNDERHSVERWKLAPA